MKQLLFFILSMLLMKCALGQNLNSYNWPNLYNEFKTKSIESKANKFKTIKVYSYKNDHQKKGKLISTENYDANGNIINKTEHDYDRYKWYDEIEYNYDSAGRFRSAIKKDPFFDGEIYYIGINYTTENKINYVFSGRGIPGKIIFDTTRYSYLENGKINYVLKTKEEFGFYYYDTSYYHYNSAGSICIASRKNDTCIDFEIRNKNGCGVGFKDTTTEKYILTCDSLCNILNDTEEIRINGKLVLWSNYKCKYCGKKLIEEEHFERKRNVFDKISENLEFDYHIKYEYDEKGFITKETRFNKRGKIIGVKKYIYESYTI